MQPSSLLVALGAISMAVGTNAAAECNQDNICYEVSDSENILAGVYVDPSTNQCSTYEACTFVVLGFKSGGTFDTFITMEQLGLGFAKLADYIDNPAGNLYTAERASDGKFHRDLKSDVSDGNGGKYAYTMTGAVYGDMDTVGGYVGIASYLNTGSTTISTNMNTVYVGDGSSASVTRDGSTQGAPKGPYAVCIGDYKDTESDKCGDDRTFAPDAYKFSIFGYTSGDNYDTAVKPGMAPFPAGMNVMGIRMKLSLIQTEGANKVVGLLVNDDAYSASKVNDQVTKLTFVYENGGGIDYTFPLKYNIGTTDTAESKDYHATGGPELMDLTATHDIKIRVHGLTVPEGEDALPFVYIDYLFDTADIGKGTYFVYDPDIKASAPGAYTTVAGTLQATCGNKDGSGAAVTDADCGAGYAYNSASADSKCASQVCGPSDRATCCTSTSGAKSTGAATAVTIVVAVLASFMLGA